VGLRVTIEFEASGPLEAEDQALAFGERMGRLCSFFAGGPTLPHELLRIARVDPAGRLIEQWDYYYDSETPPSIRLIPEELAEFLRKFAVANQALGDTLERAVHWYVASLSDASPMDAYVAAWTGLECIEARLGELFHPTGPRSPCSTCRNKAGRGRDRGKAGLAHLFRLVMPESLDDNSFQALESVRDEVVHGLQAHAALQPRASQLLPDLQLTLAKGILVARDGVTAGPQYGWQAALPRDTLHHPDARSHVTPVAALPLHRPFTGTWIDVTRIIKDEVSTVDADGVLSRRGKVQLALKLNARGSVISAPGREYEIFDRGGREYELVDLNQPSAIALPVSTWRSAPGSPAWQREVERARATRATRKPG
jgi:hypothetical protein